MAGDDIGASSFKNATIAGTASLSGEVDVLGWEVVSIEQPASCEGTAFTLQGSLDGTNFVDIQTDTAELSVSKSATVAQVIYLPVSMRLRGFSKIKVRSGTSAVPTVQVTTAAALKVGVARVC